MELLFQSSGTGPDYCRVTKSDGSPQEILMNCTSGGFDKYHDQFDHHECNSLRIISQLNEVPFNPDLSVLREPKRVSKLSFSGSGMPNDQFDDTFDFGVFLRFTELKDFENNGVSFRGELQGFFPRLERLFLTYPDNPVMQLDRCWPNLRWIRLDKFKGDLKTLGNLTGLTDLRLYGAKASSLKGIADAFPSLETLIIEGQRTSLDVRDLNKCQKLRYLKFDGFTKAEGISDLKIPSLSGAFLTKLEDSAFIDNHPDIQWMRVKNYSGDIGRSIQAKGFGRVEGQFGFGGEMIPRELRK